MSEKKNRVPIPSEISSQVLFSHDHTCCVCNEKGKPVQIHHINEDPSNNEINNLAVLCLDDHERTQLKGGFGRKLNAPEVILYRDDWVRRVAQRRDVADKLTIEKMVGEKPKTIESNEKWSPVSDIHLYSMVHAIPDILKAAYDLAKPEWNKGNTGSVSGATYDVIDVVEQTWVRFVNAAYPPNHFGKPAAEYFSDFIASRFEFRRAAIEPDGPRSAGTMVVPMVAYGVLLDVQDELVLTIRLRLLFCPAESGFNALKWEERFKNATSGYSQ